MTVAQQQGTDTFAALSPEEFTGLTPDEQRDYIAALAAREVAERGWEVESC